jgi:hypothetical protein
MNQVRPSPNLSTSLGLAGVMGCFMALFAVLSLLAGLALDEALNLERRLATLVCVLGGMPLNLFIAVRVTRLLIARIIPSDRRSAGASLPGNDDSASSSGASSV